MLWKFPNIASRLRPDWFVVSLVSVLLLATVEPCDGVTARVFHYLGMFAISSLFFLQGARLSRQAILGGITHWRLHATIASITFVVYPLIGLTVADLFPRLLPPVLWSGLLFLCTLPSTVQSSIALTSMANGNVAGAVCSATASNLAGLVLTPLLFGVIALTQGRGAGITPGHIGQILLELLVPLAAGHFLRPWIGNWAERSRRVLAVTDRASILLVVYGAFSAAVVHGVWHQLPPLTMATVSCVIVLLLSAGLLVAILAPYLLGLSTSDAVAVLFCGSQKSLVSGVPIASALFPVSIVGPALIPTMIYYPIQLVVCAWLARRYAKTTEAEQPGPAPMGASPLRDGSGKPYASAR